MNNYSQFSYDGLWRNAKIVETVSGSVTSTKQFVWSAGRRAEERDTSGILTKEYFKEGQQNGSTPYFYAFDNLGSVREMTDGAGSIQFQASFNPYGQKTNIQETVPPDFQFARYYVHSRSSLGITAFVPTAPHKVDG